MEKTEFSDSYLIEKLKGLNIFSKFGEVQLKEFVKVSELRTFKKGDTIIKEGSLDNWIYFLILGSVKLMKENQLIGVFKRAGDIFGEMRIIDASPRSASIVADAETTCLTIEFTPPKEGMENVHPVVSTILYRTFAEILADRLRKTTEELVKAKKEIERLKGVTHDKKN
ncbi:MAG: cyclic nucleotide-binding domain-containing protein [Pseudomonadota bacterium]